MAKELDFEKLFSLWGRNGKRPTDIWCDRIMESIRGRVVAAHEWSGSYAGSNNIYRYRHLFVAEDEVNTYGPYKTFAGAAKAVAFFHINDATTDVWIDKSVLKGVKIPRPWRVATIGPKRAFLSASQPSRDSSRYATGAEIAITPQTSPARKVPSARAASEEWVVEVSVGGKKYRKLPDGSYFRVVNSQFVTPGIRSPEEVAKELAWPDGQFLREAIAAFDKVGLRDVVTALRNEQTALAEKHRMAAVVTEKVKIESTNEFDAFFREWRSDPANKDRARDNFSYWAAREFVHKRLEKSGVEDDDISVRRMHQAALSIVGNWKEHFGKD